MTRSISIFSLLFLTLLPGLMRGQSCGLPVGWTPTQSWSGTASLIPLAATYTGDDIAVVDDLTVDQDLTLDACVVGVTTGKTITVTGGATLTITNGSLLTNRQVLWEGIRVEDGCAIVVDQNSTICGSEVAVGILNDGTSVADFTLDAAQLVRNTIGLAVFDYTGTAHPGTVVGTTIQGGTLPSTSGLSALGVAGATQGSIGVYLDGNDDGSAGTLVTGITLGDVSSGQNIILGLDLGIRARNSSFELRNTRLESIDAYNAGLDNGIGVLAFCNGSVTSADIRLGGGSVLDNAFDECVQGVFVKNYNNVRIVRNRLEGGSGNFERGIEVEGTLTGALVQNNDLDDFTDFGIRAINNDGADDIAIRDNLLDGTTSDNQIGIIGVEITGSTFTNYDVRDNEVYTVPRGIFLQNVENPVVEGNDLVIEAATPTVNYGIRLENGLNAEVRQNGIDGNCAFPGSCTDQVAGIFAEASEGVLYAENHVGQCRYGFYILDHSGTSNAVCNTIEDSEFGFHFDNVNTLSGVAGFGPVEQLGATSGLASDNQWGPDSVQNRTHCINGAECDSIDWFYRAVGSSPVDQFVNVDMEFVSIDANTSVPSLPIWDVDPQDVVTTINPCSLVARLSGDSIVRVPSHAYIVEEVDAMIDAAMLDPTELPLTLQRYIEMAGYRDLEDARLDFLRGYTLVPELEAVFRDIHQKDFDAAQATLAGVIAGPDHERALVDIWNVFLEAARHHQTSIDTGASPLRLPADCLTEAQMDLLDSVASAPYEQTGEAKFMARALRWQRDYGRGTPSLKTNAQEEEHDWLTVHPNPATAWVMVKTDGRALGTIRLYNAIGGLVLRQDGCTGMLQCRIQLPSGTEGMHFLQSIDGSGNRVSIPLILLP